MRKQGQKNDKVQEAFAKLATAICEVPAKGRASISTKPIAVAMGEERSELCPRRHEQSAIASFAKASIYRNKKKTFAPDFRGIHASIVDTQ